MSMTKKQIEKAAAAGQQVYYFAERYSGSSPWKECKVIEHDAQAKRWVIETAEGQKRVRAFDLSQYQITVSCGSAFCGSAFCVGEEGPVNE